MLRRWNLTVLIIILAFVVGTGVGYIYRDRFSWLLPNTNNLERNQPDISQEIFRTEVSELLKPTSGSEATTGVSEVYSFTGRIYALSSSALTVEQPNDTTDTLDAIDFILTDTTRYETVQAVTDVNGLPGTVMSPITGSDLSVDDIVAVYTLEDIKTSTEHHATVVQKIIAAADSSQESGVSDEE